MGVLRDYYDSEMERWDETKSDPLGTFADNLRFGLTGPAPSLQPNPDDPFRPKIDRGPTGIDTVNKKAESGLVKITGFSPMGDELGDPDGGGFVKVIVGIVTLFAGIYVLGQLVTFNVGGS